MNSFSRIPRTGNSRVNSPPHPTRVLRGVYSRHIDATPQPGSSHEEYTGVLAIGWVEKETPGTQVSWSVQGYFGLIGNGSGT